VVLVTGASSGIGRQVALEFAAQGAKLALVARRAARLEAVAAACRDASREASPDATPDARREPGCKASGEVQLLVGDLGERGFARSLVERIVAHYGRLDVVVNNAGMPKHKQIYDVSLEDLDQTLEVNFMAPAAICLAALPVMLRQGGGALVNVSSVAGRVAPPRETIYAASKFALTGFSEGLAQDLAGSGIHTVVVHVGPIDTEIWGKAAAEAPVAYRGRKYPPERVSEAIFRCLEEHRFERSVPRSMGLVGVLKALLPGLLRRGNARFDPVSGEVVARARRAAQQRH